MWLQRALFIAALISRTVAPLYSQATHDTIHFDARGASVSNDDLPSQDTLGTLVHSILPAIFRYYHITPEVRWAPDPRDTTINAVEGPGITLGRAKVVSLREELDSRSFSDVLEFVLSHEIAHMEQYSRFPEMASDPRQARVRECHADIRAGMAIHAILSDLGVTSAEFSERTRNIYAAALAVGHGMISSGPQQYPPRAERSLCATLGVGGGFQFRMISFYRATGNPQILREIEGNHTSNPYLPMPTDDTLSWSLELARTITGYGGRTLFPGGGIDYLGMIRRGAVAAQTGSSVLIRDTVGYTWPAPAQCRTVVMQSVASYVCTEGGFNSKGAAENSYELTSGMFQNVLSMMGWRVLGVDYSGGRRVAFVSPGPQPAGVEVSYSTAYRTVTIRFSAGGP